MLEGHAEAARQAPCSARRVRALCCCLARHEPHAAACTACQPPQPPTVCTTGLFNWVSASAGQEPGRGAACRCRRGSCALPSVSRVRRVSHDEWAVLLQRPVEGNPLSPVHPRRDTAGSPAGAACGWGWRAPPPAQRWRRGPPPAQASNHRAARELGMSAGSERVARTHGVFGHGRVRVVRQHRAGSARGRGMQ